MQPHTLAWLVLLAAFILWCEWHRAKHDEYTRDLDGRLWLHTRDGWHLVDGDTHWLADATLE